jgi:hypothetical protein
MMAPISRSEASTVSERDRILWTAIRRALMLAVAAIDTYLKASAPAGQR